MARIGRLAALILWLVASDGALPGTADDAQRPAGAVVRVDAVELDPAPGERLHHRDVLHARIRYQSDIPIRFRIAPFTRGEPVGQVHSSTMPLYPAGVGEAIAWIEPQQAVYVEEFRIIVLDSAWQPRLTHAVAGSILWSREPRSTPRPSPPWVQQLDDARQAMTRNDLQAPASAGLDGWSVIVMLMGWSVPGYFILQVYTLRRFRAGWRKAALAPLLITIPLLVYTAFALLAQSNLWPLLLIFFTPVAFLYLAGLAMVRYLQSGGASPLHRA